MFVTVFLAAYAAGPDMGPTNGADYAGMDYNVTQWNTPKSKSADNYKSSALACEAYCDADPKCCAWTCETDAPYTHRPARSAPTSRLHLGPHPVVVADRSQTRGQRCAVPPQTARLALAKRRSQSLSLCPR